MSESYDAETERIIDLQHATDLRLRRERLESVNRFMANVGRAVGLRRCSACSAGFVDVDCWDCSYGRLPDGWRCISCSGSGRTEERCGSCDGDGYLDPAR